MRQLRAIPVIVMLALVVVSFGAPSPAAAWSGCGSSYVVQWGDTLGSVAGMCGTSVAALRLANPNLGYWLYAGQTLWMPGAYVPGSDGSDTYYVAPGDTLKKLAARFGTTVEAIANANHLWNYNLIYVGQKLFIPTGGTYYPPSDPPSYPPPSSGTYVVQWGDTMRKIAAKFSVSLQDLIAANPHIPNPNLIYRGQTVYLPGSGSLYTIQRGDTMKKIAANYGTTVQSLVSLNPQIWNVNLIYPGQVIRIW